MPAKQEQFDPVPSGRFHHLDDSFDKTPHGIPIKGG
jgi:hypothetical protein